MYIPHQQYVGCYEFQSDNVWILFKTVMKYLHWSFYKTIEKLYHSKAATRSCMYTASTMCRLTWISVYERTYMNIVNNSNKISTLINLQNNTDVISRHSCNGNTHNVDAIQMHLFKLHVFIDRTNKHMNTYYIDI